MKYELSQLMEKPITATTYSGSYITSDPKMLDMLRKGNSFNRKRSPLDESPVPVKTSNAKRRRKH